MGRYCSVPQCFSWSKRNPNLQFHAFPQVGDKYRVWVEGKAGSKVLTDRRKAWQLKLKIDKRITTHMRVCSLHFTDEDYFSLGPNSKQRKCLKRIAVPSKNLPVASTTKAEEQPVCSSRSERLKRRSLNKGRLGVAEECSEEFKPTAQTASSDEIEAAEGLLQLLQGQPDYVGPKTFKDFEVK